MGKLATFSLHNRALIALITVFVAVFGAISAGALKMELIPNLQMPVVGVIAPYPGASPEAVEQQVVKPLESALAGVDGLEQITSTSAPSSGTVMVQVEYGTDLDRAKLQVESALSDVQTLPDDVDPIVFAGDFDQFPIVQLAVTSDQEPAELASSLERFAVPEFEDIDGVRQVAISGGPVDRVEVSIKPKAAAKGVNAGTLTTALDENGRMMPMGTVDSGDKTLSVQVGTTPTSLDELKQVAVRLPDSSVTTLGAVATVALAPEEATSYSRTDGEDSIALAITKTPDGNTVDISNQVGEVIGELEEKLGDGTTFTVVFDQAPFIEKSIEDLLTEGGLGLLFAVGVILVFLFSLRSTLVTAISIPLSLLVTLIGLRVGGYSLNILTLGALTVAIGRVVDDSIVVIENIKRHLSYGEEKRPAIITAVREVGGAITSSTIATAAVFVPIGLVSGQVGELFRPFAFTVALALLASLLVALTIVPVLAYWFMPETHGPVDVEQVKAEAEAHEDRSFLRRLYDPALTFSIRRPWTTVAVAMVILLGTVALYPLIKTNFLGDSGQNTVTVSQELEPGASLAAQDEAAREVEEVLVGLEGVTSVQTTVGSSGVEALFTGGGTSFSLMLDEDVEPADFADDLTLKLAEAPGDVTVSATDSGFGSALAVSVTGTDNESMEAAADLVLEEMQQIDGIGQVTSDAAAAQPIISIGTHEGGRTFGWTDAQLAGVVGAALNDAPLGEITIDGKSVDVVAANPKPARTLEELEKVDIGFGVTLPQAATVEEELVATGISRIDGQRTITISAEPAAEDLGSLTAEVSTMLDGLDLPEGTEATLGGVAEDQAEAFAQLGLALLVAVAIVYVVMVATFRSLVQPLILMVSVPFAATGVLALLAVTGIPLGVPSLIGALMLVGIVVTNAIVLIDLVNQARERGEGIVEALEHGGHKRVRPIVMTALATILALTPMGLGLTGGSAFISQPLAIVVIGGLVSSTALTLLLVPALYLLVERRKEKRAAKKQARRQARRAASAEGEALPGPTL
ncbi:MAG: efflux RND transporter permease subunit [Nocardioides sp.]|uniref:efflux RND transporter permease subunit n=1 Tax=Nocardioides sp. TaxID=35761 RepID=UPI003F106291